MQKITHTRFYLLVFIVYPVVLSISTAQVIESWSARYNGASNTFDGANAMAIDKTGNVYVTGTANRIANNPDYCTIKYKSNGDTAWVRYYNGTGNNVDIANAIAVDTVGNVYVTGSSKSAAGFGTEDYFTIKYSAAGETLWTHRYNGPGNGGDVATSIGLDDSANVYVSGGSNGGTSAQDIFTIKYNTNGVVQWTQRLMGTATFGFSDWAYSMAVTNNGNVHVAGYTDNVNSFWDFATVKYNREGVFQWKGAYQGPVHNVSEQANAVAVDASGNVYITGTSAANATTDLEDIVTIKYNSGGAQQWIHRYNASGYDIGNAIAVNANGNVFVGGASNGSMTTIKYTLSGDTAWIKKYPGTGQSQVYSIAVDGSDNVYVAGRSADASGIYDFVTIKYNAAGDTVWTKKYNGPANAADEARAIQVDAQGNVYVSGNSTGSGTNGDFYTVKYSQPTTDVEVHFNTIPSEFQLFQNFPNPFNPTTEIRFQISEMGLVALKIYDLLGKEVVTLVNEVKDAGNYSATFHAKNLASGIYFSRLTSNGKVKVNKLLLMK
jgi:uncharacterized delta-60 repeat protein